MKAKIRPLKFTRKYTRYAEGSVLVEMGETKVLCNASIQEDVPKFLKGTGKGWVTAEYSMLPRSTKERTSRESATGRPAGRSQEIQRLIGRSLRSVLDREALGERQVIIDCDVLQADGGTRTASINGAYVALVDALENLKGEKAPKRWPLREAVAAVSVGWVRGKPAVDMCYDQDSKAEVDLNVVMTESGRFVEIQGTAEQEPFDRRRLDLLLDLARQAIRQVSATQKKALDEK